MIHTFEINGPIRRAFHAEADVEVCSGGAALHAIGANRSDRCARISDVAVSRKSAGGSFKPIMSEGMSPYEMYYVLATDEEIQRLNELNATIGVH